MNLFLIKAWIKRKSIWVALRILLNNDMLRIMRNKYNDYWELKSGVDKDFLEMNFWEA